ncbi:MAG: hypothetical protein J6X29_00665 [Clostridia bacterium]|nr:hypothetical protein [Clostridia bacterium]
MNKKKALSIIHPLLLSGICHRGLHGEGATENGLKAFSRAIENGMAFEFDVHLTLDGELVVFHDSDMRRITGKEGIIEDLTSDIIRSEYALPDGGLIPTLKEVLDLTDEKVPVVLELKVYNKNYKALVAAVKKELERIKDKRNVMIISFDPRALFPFKRSGFFRSFLVCEKEFWTYPFRFFFESIDIEKKLLERAKVRKYVAKHLTNVWTIESEEELKEALKYGELVTFQFVSPEIVKGIASKKQ